jgi:hypothetical protein
MNEAVFDYVTGVVIDKLEGGYFHPDMRSRNPSKFGAYHRSGETMFGLDRHAGHDLYYSTKRITSDVLANLKYIYNGSYQYKSDDAKEFWQTIDNANARKNWNWLYKGGNSYSRLKKLTGGIMLPHYTKLANRYLSEKSREIVASDPRILFHFIYACWNGSGWFKKFAEKFNNAVINGTTNKNELLNVAIKSRTQSGNSLIAQGGNKINAFIYDFKVPTNLQSEIKDSGGSGGGSGIMNGLLLGLGFVAGWILWRKYKNKPI